MINIQNAMQMIQAIRNPQQTLANMGIPQEHLNSPDDAAQFLLNSGKISQQQIQQVKTMYQQFMGGKQ